MISVNTYSKETERAFHQSTLILHTTMQGWIHRVLQNDLNPPISIHPGETLLQLVDRDSRSKVMNFLLAIRKERITTSWEVNIVVNDVPMAMYLIGVAQDDSFLIIGSYSDRSIHHQLTELTRIFSNQLLHIRDLNKSQSTEETAVASTHQDALSDSLMKLNNELTTMQRQLALQNETLNQLNQQKNQFLGMAAHDLRNPLNIILNYSQFLLEDFAKAIDDAQRDYLHAIQEQSEYMLTLVNSFLDVSTIESVGLQLQKKPVDLFQLITTLHRRNQVLYQQKSIDIELSCPSDLPIIEADEHKVMQVINNLVSNAAKFSPPGSLVKVSVSRQGNDVLFQVADEGPGIPLAEQNKLFQMFSRTSVQSTAGESSTGLGLAISHKIVTAHNGKIWVNSEEGQGATFAFTLPVGETPASEVRERQTAVSSPPVQPSTPVSWRVLIAEDNLINQKVLTRLLSRLDVTAEAVANGTAVLTHHTKTPYDIIFMDVHMPEMDGLTASRHIRQDFPQDQQPYIIATTASMQPDDLKQCHDAGMDDAINKPTNLDELTQVLQRAATWKETRENYSSKT